MAWHAMPRHAHAMAPTVSCTHLCCLQDMYSLPSELRAAYVAALGALLPRPVSVVRRATAGCASQLPPR